MVPRMARPREFDIDHAVDQAMELFWRQGFEATSLHDLLGELGIGKGSLYAAFGSKEQLYARSLERYCGRHAAGLIERLETARPLRAALHDVLRKLAEADLADPERGCLLVNAAVERSDHPGTVDRVAATMQLIEAALVTALAQARTRGELGAGADPRELARFLTTFVQGLRVMGKARAGREFLDDAVGVALRVLD